MECIATHHHKIIYTPRNALAEEQARTLYEKIKPYIQNAKIEENHSAHIAVKWTEQAWIGDGKEVKEQ